MPHANMKTRATPLEHGFRVVPEERLEPSRTCVRQILSQLRLPLHHSGTHKFVWDMNAEGQDLAKVLRRKNEGVSVLNCVETMRHATVDISAWRKKIHEYPFPFGTICGIMASVQDHNRTNHEAFILYKPDNTFH